MNKLHPFRCFLCNSPSSDCLLSDAESSSSDGPVADKRAPGSERAAERAAQQNERERIRLAPQTSFANMQVNIWTNSAETPFARANNERSNCPLLSSGVRLRTEKAVGNQRSVSDSLYIISLLVVYQITHVLIMHRLFNWSNAKETCGDRGADPYQHLEWSGLLKVHASWDHQGAAESQSRLI